LLERLVETARKSNASPLTLWQRMGGTRHCVNLVLVAAQFDVS